MKVTIKKELTVVVNLNTKRSVNLKYCICDNNQVISIIR